MFNGQLTPQPNWLQWDGATGTWSIFISSPATNQLGVWTVENTATAAGVSQTFTFTITVACVISSFTVNSQPSPTYSYNLDAPGFNTTALSLTQVSNCQQPFTYTPSFTLNGTATTQPSWLMWDAATMMWQVAMIASPSPAALGAWGVSNLASAGGFSQAYSFTINVNCVISNFTVVSQPMNANYTLDSPGFTTAPLSLNQVSNCQIPITNTPTFLLNGVSATQPSWLTWDPATMTWTVAMIASPNASALGTWTVNNQASAGGFSQTYSFTISVTCVLSSFTVVSQPMTMNYVLGQTTVTNALNLV